MKRIITVCALAVLVCVAVAHSETEIVPDISVLDPNMAVADPGGSWLWYDAQALPIEGKGWTDTESFYHRLPSIAKGVVRDAVWSLSTHSAGMCVRFSTDARRIAARWEVANATLAMPHMPATGVSGLDLYVNCEGEWRWIGNGRPSEQATEAVLATGIPDGSHEYLLYLPLYNGVNTLAIGVPPGATLAQPAARPAEHAKPIVFYGTSITHGGCASRPGMAYPAIIGRRLGHPVINLGFSGNGRMEPEMGELLAELDAAVYVLDCLPNMKPADVAERLAPFVVALRKARPETPIILVENIQYQAGAFLPERHRSYTDKNDALRKSYEFLCKENVPGLRYIPCAALLEQDGEATVDGTHPTDLGFMRMADTITPVLREALSQ